MKTREKRDCHIINKHNPQNYVELMKYRIDHEIEESDNEKALNYLLGIDK